MDFRSSALIPALYLILGITVVGVGCIAFLIYRPTAGERATQQFAEATKTSDDPRFRNPPQVSSRVALETNESYAKTVQRMLHLEELLEKRTALLEKKSVLLEQKDAEYRQLKQEVDDYLLLLSQLAPMDVPDVGSEDSTNGEPSASQETTALQRQLQQLRTRLSETEQTERKLELELADLKIELNNAYAEMAEQQLAAVIGHDDAVSQASARVLVGMGAEAIPEVVGLLSDRRAEVRVWAASVIGQFGPLADDSVPRLRSMLSDPDARVRDAARRSIDLILD